MKTVAIQKKSSIQNVRMLTMTAVLSAIDFVLAFFEFPVPLSPLRVWTCRTCPR